MDTPRELKSVELPNQIKLPYVEQGDASGVPVLLLHGFAGSWHSFERVLAHLPGSIHALAPTLRGHGDASRPAAGYGLPDFAADVAAFMQALDLEAAVLVGHSMGSAVALRFAIDHPGRTAGLVLVGASATTRGTPAAREYWDTILSQLTDPVDPDLVRQMTEGDLAQLVPEEFCETLVREGLKVPAHVWRATFESRWRLEGDFEAELGGIRAPTLIIWGQQDARYSPGDQDALAAAIPNSRLRVYPGAGHAPHWEEPERFASDLVAFVEELGHSPDHPIITR